MLNPFQSYSTIVSIKICPMTFGKNSNIEKGKKQIINNYKPVSLLPISKKVFERIIFNCLYDYFEKKKKLLSDRQAGFWSNYSCVSHNLYNLYKLCNLHFFITYTNLLMLILLSNLVGSLRLLAKYGLKG